MLVGPTPSTFLVLEGGIPSIYGWLSHRPNSSIIELLGLVYVVAATTPSKILVCTQISKPSLVFHLMVANTWSHSLSSVRVFFTLSLSAPSWDYPTPSTTWRRSCLEKTSRGTLSWTSHSSGWYLVESCGTIQLLCHPRYMETIYMQRRHSVPGASADVGRTCRSDFMPSLLSQVHVSLKASRHV